MLVWLSVWSEVQASTFGRVTGGVSDTFSTQSGAWSDFCIVRLFRMLPCPLLLKTRLAVYSRNNDKCSNFHQKIMLAAAHLRTSSRELEAITGMATQNLDEDHS